MIPDDVLFVSVASSSLPKARLHAVRVGSNPPIVMLAPEKTLECPYNPAHQIRSDVFQRHLIKCAKNHPGVELETCPLNLLHRIKKGYMAEHMQICPDRTQLERHVMESLGIYTEDIMAHLLAVVVAAFLISAVISPAQSVAVMSIDLGSEWMKVAVVSPGMPMEIALNKESKRKTPVAVAFRDGERVFGEDAQNVGSRFPKQAYIYLLDVLGKTPDNPLVQQFLKRFPQYEIVADPETGLAVFRHDENTLYSPEELIAMILNKGREYAQEFVEQKPIKDVVITVPAFFNQAERRAMLRAAELANLKVLQLINDNTAAALNYGIFRRKEFTETPQRILFFDMGASSTVATVASYQIAKTKERGFVETNPQVSIIGIGYDRTLGGLEMQLRLRDHLANVFNSQKKTPNDVFKNPRSMQKLFKEAGRLKNVLSANSDHVSQVEGLLDEQDFRAPVTRDEFETLCADLFERVAQPLKDAVSSAGLSLEHIDQVILVGAGTRVPKVQEKIHQYVSKELGKSLNTDEAAAMGAVYRAADQSPAFKVKKFVVKDAVIYPVQVDYVREVTNEDGTVSSKTVRSSLFGPMNPYPQKKIMSFRKHVDDFSFNVNYGDLSHLPASDAANLGSLNISEVKISGVSDAINKHSANQAEGTSVDMKGVKAHFVLDESGVVRLTSVEYVIEKTETKKHDAESPLSRLGNTISAFFSGGKEENEAGAETEAPSSDAQPKENASASTNETVANAETKTNATSDGKPVVSNIKETLKILEILRDVVEPSAESLETRAKRLEELNAADNKRHEREAARNALESFALDVQDKFTQEEFERATTSEERDIVLAECSTVSDWLYEDGFDAEATEFRSRLSSLKSKTAAIFDRVAEHARRPEMLEYLETSVASSKNFSAEAKAMKEELFTKVELETLDKLITDTEKWRDTKLAEQDALALTSKPVLTLSMIAEKMQALDREIKYLVNKGKINAARKAEEIAAKKAEEAKKKAEADGSNVADEAKKVDDAFKLPPNLFDPSKMTPDQMELLKSMLDEKLKENPESAKVFEQVLKATEKLDLPLKEPEVPSPLPQADKVSKTDASESEVNHSEL
ncbi:unnamed protein product [Notodromas monacha]|uniref:Hypoxia up-regulated protein 1 n=1 Tax=Notodromas monacha TaxID=399045 RepID=A0A7R9GAN9_9CRUS|nr:unnamed protein product [Notodromas monacha]CAG0915624.1 unnamed protein product [Notodromas monacha]